MNFDEADELFKSDKIGQLAEISDGLRFLKLRSLSRKDHLKQLFCLAGIRPTTTRAGEMLREAFEASEIDAGTIEQFIRTIYNGERKERRNLESMLVSELYKIQAFDWGGLHQNSLERTIVDQYVKKITDYETLNGKVENELHQSMRGYVLCSWYNHWTSIIIEDTFRDHPKVLPAVGQIKKIDFFVSDVPFDLKVTHLPEGYIAESRRTEGLRPELTLLRQFARQNRIHFDGNVASSQLLQDLWAKLRDYPSVNAQALLSDLSNYRIQLLNNSQSEPTGLIRWLYENQGIRRFDASNRLFLVLVDQTNFFDSWKLKRAKPLLEQGIHSYLNNVGNTPGRQVEFTWENGNTYSVLSDIVFVVNP